MNAATVFGASSSSQRATKRIPAATISSTENLRRRSSAMRDEARRRRPEERPEVEAAVAEVEVVAVSAPIAISATSTIQPLRGP